MKPIRPLAQLALLVTSLLVLLATIPSALAQNTTISQNSTTNATVTANATAAGWKYYQVSIPAGSPGWRLVLAPRNGAAGNARLHVRKNLAPTGTGDAFRSATAGARKTIVLDESEATAGTWFVGVELPAGSTAEDFTLQSRIGWVTFLAWDPGTSENGTQTFSIPVNDIGGTHYFRITTENADFALWRQVLRVTSGEANLYLKQDSPASQLANSAKSERVGSDGLVAPLSSSTGAGQTWYLTVEASAGAVWSLFAGDIHVRDLGSLAMDASSGSGADAVPIEGWRFYRTTIPNNALGWRMWLQQADGTTTWNQTFRLRKNNVPHPALGSDREFTGQALEVPPYLSPGSNDAYFVSIAAEPATTFRFDSRQQEVTNLVFNGTSASLPVSGYLFRTFRFTVPQDQLGWEVTTLREAGDPNLAVRRSLVPNARQNEALSEAAGAVDDSVTLVQPDLADGTFFVTVHSSAPYTFRLRNRTPVVSPVAFTGNISNNDPNRTGWRYYSITDIDSQVGKLGWLLRLTGQVPPGSQIALRRNNLPGQWDFRNDGYQNYTSRSDFQSASDTLQRPNHQADVWYVGVYSPTAALGNFTLNTGELIPGLLPIRTSQNVNNLPVGDWKFYRIDVPETWNGQPVQGWELRASSSNGAVPGFYVRRDQLPQGGTSTNFNFWSQTSWQSGYEQASSSDWTKRESSPTGEDRPTTFLSCGMGQPLEPGTYYIGFHRASSSESGNFTWTSKVVGDFGSGLDYEIRPLLAGATVNGTLAPREVAYFAVDVPAGVASQKFKLSLPAGHEGRLYMRKDVLPNSLGAHAISSSEDVGLTKTGGEHWTQLPESNETTLAPGRYYLLVASEGQNPPNASRIGTGNISYTLTHLGEAPVNDLGVLVAGGNLASNGSFEAGEVKLHRFTVGEGVSAVEVRLQNTVGTPVLAIRQGEFAPNYYPTSYGYYSGHPASDISENLATISNPEPGVYSVVVSGEGMLAGSYTLRVSTTNATQVPIRTTQNVNNLPVGEWKYYRIDVPETFNGQAVRGWELRASSSNGSVPQFSVRRDQLPQGGVWFQNFYFPTSWPTGNQQASSSDWTKRESSPTGEDRPTTFLSCGMGQPLEPGTYYIGFHRASSSESGNFTWTSKVVGDFGSGMDYEIRPLVSGATVNGTLAPREVAYFAVDVPAGVASQKFKLSLPAGHEGRLYMRKDVLPNSLGEHAISSSEDVGLTKTGGEHWTQLPESNQTTLAAGRYYLLVASEGQNPPNASRIGTGNISYTLTHLGEAPVNDLGVLVAGGNLASNGSFETGEVKLHRFTVPAGLVALEVRLENRVGSPGFAIRKGEVAPYLFHPASIVRNPYGHFSGYGISSLNEISDNLVTIPNPEPGVYSVVVGHCLDGEPQPGSYRIRATAMVAANLDAAGPGAFSGSFPLIAGQSRFFSVDVPVESNYLADWDEPLPESEPVLGWRLDLFQSTGSARVRVRRGAAPEDTPGIQNQSDWKSGSLLAVPTFLTPGKWIVEVQGVTDSTSWLSSSVVLDSSMWRIWTMPASGQVSTHPGLASGFFGDSGVFANGIPLSGDQGVDLPVGNYHFYAIDVPENNGGLLRTVLEAIGGNPDLYIRPAHLPSLDHTVSAPNGLSAPAYRHELTDTTQSDYGSWVPLDVKAASKLEAGRWYLKVHAAGNTNARYRLRLSHDATPRVQNLALNGGSFANQTLAGSDWRYYRVQMPSDPAAMPQQWTLTFSQTQGSVAMYLRDSAPPGQWATNSPSTGEIWYSNPIDWSNEGLDPGNYRRFTTPGTRVINGRHLRPGKTYYLGFRANTDASFSVSSSASAATLGAIYGTVTTLNATGGNASVVLAANQKRTWRIESPAEATRWRHVATHEASVEVYLNEEFFPGMDGNDWWRSNGTADSSLASYFSGEARARTLYLTAVNTSGAAQPFSLSVDWRQYQLSVLSTNGSVSIDPSGGLYDIGDTVVLTAWPDSNYQFNGWGGNATGTANPLTLVMDGNKTITANFGPVQRTLTLNAENGTITANPSKATYDQGEKVTLTAMPSAGYRFANWSGGFYSEDNPVDVFMDWDYDITAVFEPLENAGFDFWSVLAELPSNRRGMLDRNGPQNLPNLLAYAMGLNPLTATAADLPFTGNFNAAARTIDITYRRAKNLPDVALTVEGSSSLTGGFTTATVASESMLVDGSDHQTIRATISVPAGATRYFLRLRANGTP